MISSLKRDGVALTLGILLSALIGFVVLLQRPVVALDYRAFYCAGAALRHGLNPYHTASLQVCELNDTDDQYRQRLSTTTLPAPQPLYDISLFALLSILPFAVSKAVWGAVIGVSIFITILSLIRLTGLSPPLIVGLLGISLIGDALALGQIIPIYTAAACAAALLATRRKWAWAGVAASLALVEPHLGVPICVCLALWAPRARLAVGVGAGVLAALALLVGGLAANVEYLTTVLPLHALSELDSDGQLSLSVVLHALGVGSSQAIQVGSISYIVMSIVGVFAGRAACVRFKNPAFLVVVPAATALVGGSFLHNTDIVAAIPLVLLLTTVSQFRALSVAALVLLATPWSAESNPEEMVPWLLISSIIVGYAVCACGRISIRASAVLAAVLFVILCQTNFSYARTQRVYASQNHVMRSSIDEKYPQASWARIIEANLSTQSVQAWIIRMPTWAGLILLVIVTFAAVHHRSTFALQS